MTRFRHVLRRYPPRCAERNENAAGNKFVAVERKGAKIGRIRMECIPATGDSLQVATRNNIESGTVVRTDGWGGWNCRDAER